MGMTVLIGLATTVALAAGTVRVGIAADAGTVSGKVSFLGTVPAAKKLPVTKDNQVCGSEKVVEEVSVGAEKGLKNAVVALLGAKGTPTATPIALDQKGCEFTPRVLALPAGASLDILNNDGILHNIHTMSTINASINKAQPGFKKKMTEKFESPEIVRVTCDVHSWMSGWIVVSDSGFVAVTDDKGAFQLANVPPGTYKLEVWHETLGKQVKDVTVKAGADSKVTFDLK